MEVLKLLPSVVVAVIIAVPTLSFAAVITLVFSSTPTIVGSLDVHFTVLFVALSGVTVAVKLSVPFTFSESVVLFNDIPVAKVVD